MRIVADITHDNKIILSPDNIRYLKNIMRVRDGENIEVINGKGTLLNARIEITEDGDILCKAVSTFTKQQSQYNIVLCPCIIKGQRMDWLIEKVVEIGVHSIQPLISNRTVIRYTNKTDRWQKIANEAARQSKKTIIPNIFPPMQFDEFLLIHKLQGLIFWERSSNSVKYALNLFLKQGSIKGQIYLLVGPEGSFSDDEINIAISQGLIPCSLGNEILRAETAGIVATVLVKNILD